MGRKTINVKDILEKCNTALESQAEGATQEFKSGVCTMLESILFDTGNYAGFRYLPSAGLTNPGTVDVKVENEFDRRYIINPQLTK